VEAIVIEEEKLNYFWENIKRAGVVYFFKPIHNRQHPVGSERDGLTSDRITLYKLSFICLKNVSEERPPPRDSGKVW
jgi:hypothetical protein